MMQPKIVPRPALAQWLFDRNMTLREAAFFFDTTHETLRRAVLPFADAGMRPPYPGLMRRIIERTGGAITANDWYQKRRGGGVNPRASEADRETWQALVSVAKDVGDHWSAETARVLRHRAEAAFRAVIPAGERDKLLFYRFVRLAQLADAPRAGELRTLADQVAAILDAPAPTQTRKDVFG